MDASTSQPVSMLESLDMEGVVKFLQQNRVHNVVTMCGYGISTGIGAQEGFEISRGDYMTKTSYVCWSKIFLYQLTWFTDEITMERRVQQAHDFDRLRKVGGRMIASVNGVEHEVVKFLVVGMPIYFKIFEEYRTDGDKRGIFDWFKESYFKDLRKCDLLLMLGDPLAAEPLCHLIHLVKPNVPRIFVHPEYFSGYVGDSFNITLNRLRSVKSKERLLAWEKLDNSTDVFLEGAPDVVIKSMVEKLGWKFDSNCLMSVSEDLNAQMTSSNSLPQRTSISTNFLQMNNLNGTFVSNDYPRNAKCTSIFTCSAITSHSSDNITDSKFNSQVNRSLTRQQPPVPQIRPRGGHPTPTSTNCLDEQPLHQRRPVSQHSDEAAEKERDVNKRVLAILKQMTGSDPPPLASTTTSCKRNLKRRLVVSQQQQQSRTTSHPTESTRVNHSQRQHQDVGQSRLNQQQSSLIQQLVSLRQAPPSIRQGTAGDSSTQLGAIPMVTSNRQSTTTSTSTTSSTQSVTNSVVNTSTTSPTRHCTCVHSSCLKLYCECFAAGQYCRGCICYQCKNNPANGKARQLAVARVVRSRPNAFKSKIVQASDNNEGGVHVRGCNCRRSGCSKNYCECFEARIACSDRCRCSNCANVFGSSLVSRTATSGDENCPADPSPSANVAPPSQPASLCYNPNLASNVADPLDVVHSPVVPTGPIQSSTSSSLLGLSNPCSLTQQLVMMQQQQQSQQPSFVATIGGQPQSLFIPLLTSSSTPTNTTVGNNIDGLVSSTAHQQLASLIQQQQQQQQQQSVNQLPLSAIDSTTTTLGSLLAASNLLASNNSASLLGGVPFSNPAASSGLIGLQYPSNGLLAATNSSNIQSPVQPLLIPAPPSTSQPTIQLPVSATTDDGQANLIAKLGNSPSLINAVLALIAQQQQNTTPVPAAVNAASPTTSLQLVLQQHQQQIKAAPPSPAGSLSSSTTNSTVGATSISSRPATGTTIPLFVDTSTDTVCHQQNRLRLLRSQQVSSPLSASSLTPPPRVPSSDTPPLTVVRSQPRSTTIPSGTTNVKSASPTVPSNDLVIEMVDSGRERKPVTPFATATTTGISSRSRRQKQSKPSRLCQSTNDDVGECSSVIVVDNDPVKIKQETGKKPPTLLVTPTITVTPEGDQQRIDNSQSSSMMIRPRKRRRRRDLERQIEQLTSTCHHYSLAIGRLQRRVERLSRELARTGRRRSKR